MRIISFAACCLACIAPAVAAPLYEAELVFPLNDKHNHAAGVVECPNGDLLVSWYRGSGERSADDVAVYGARQLAGRAEWSEPFIMADTPGFPDCNTCMWIDGEERLWLFWPIILANTWESCLTRCNVSSDYQRPGPPTWDESGLVLLKPADFKDEVEKKLKPLLEQLGDALPESAQRDLDDAREKLGNKLYQRLGWQPRCKPTQLPSGRILLPLYSDTFEMSIMAVSDDQGKTWYASQPLIGFGNIQPTVLRRHDGTLVAYMRENGLSQHIRMSTSKDEGLTWGPVENADFPNPGAGIDGIRLASGKWLLVYNDTTDERNSLAVSLSDDEGQTWKWTRHLERHPSGSYHYPAVIQARDGAIHAVYTYSVDDGESMKHAKFNEDWVMAQEPDGQ